MHDIHNRIWLKCIKINLCRYIIKAMLVVNHSIVVVCYCSKCFLSGLIRTFLTRSHTGVDQTAGWFRNTVSVAENS